jgi:pimeloyl-ACP methyl ester carboxylesterase
MAAEIRSGQFALLPNDTRLHYASAGQPGAPLLLFVHGFPEFWYEWEAQLAEFGGEYFAVAPDLRGFNLSDQPGDVAHYKARLIVDDLRMLINHLGYEQCILVAHDWGGAIAWNLAISMPQLLHKLIIINSPHPYLFAEALAHDPQQQAASEYMNWLRAPGSELALAKDDFTLVEGFFKGMDQAPWFKDEVRQKYHACWRRGLLGGVNYYRASPLHPPVAGHPGPTDRGPTDRGPTDRGPTDLHLTPDDFRVTVPTRVIWGERDHALPKSLLDGLDQVVDDLQVERIPEGTHWVIHEQPERINRLLRQFLAS